MSRTAHRRDGAYVSSASSGHFSTNVRLFQREPGQLGLQLILAYGDNQQIAGVAYMPRCLSVPVLVLSPHVAVQRVPDSAPPKQSPTGESASAVCSVDVADTPVDVAAGGRVFAVSDDPDSRSRKCRRYRCSLRRGRCRGCATLLVLRRGTGALRSVRRGHGHCEGGRPLLGLRRSRRDRTRWRLLGRGPLRHRGRRRRGRLGSPRARRTRQRDTHGDQ